MAKLNGTLLLVYADGTLIAAQKGVTFTVTQNLFDTTNKESAGWAEHGNGLRSVEVSIEALASTTGLSAKELKDFIISRKSLILVIQGTDYPYICKADVQSSTISGPLEDATTLTGSFKGSGNVYHLSGSNALLFTDFDNVDYDTFTEALTVISSAINSAGAASARSDTFGVTSGDVVKVFGKDGKLVRGMAKLVDKFVNADYPRQGIYECVLCGDEVALWDVLFVDGMDCTPLPYQERVDLFMSAAKTGSYSGWDEILTDTELHRIGNKEALYNLTAGKWLVRHQDEVLSDSIIKPFWFVRDAGTVNIGTLLPWVTPAASVEDASGMIVVKQTGLPSMQIHKKGKSVNVYVAEGGRNRDTNLPQVVELARLLPEDFVMEAQWTCLENGVPVSAGRVQNPKSNLAECEIVLYPYDLLVYGDMNLIDKPMYERVDVLEKVVDELANERIVMGLDDEGGIAFDADSVRHLDGDCSHCFTVK